MEIALKLRDYVNVNALKPLDRLAGLRMGWGVSNWKLFTTCGGKLDRLLSLGPLYFAIQDLLASWARVSSTNYTYRHTYPQCVSTFLGI
jgi:hypothetical protein